MSASFETKQNKFNVLRTDGLLSSFRFNETTGDFYDSSGLTSVKLITYDANVHDSNGKIGGCSVFNANTFCQLGIGNYLPLSASKYLSFCFWYKTTSLTPGGSYLVRFVNSTSSYTVEDIRFYITDNYSYRTKCVRIGDFRYTVGDVTVSQYVDYDTAINGNWHFYAVTIDRDASDYTGYKLYLDSSLVSSEEYYVSNYLTGTSFLDQNLIVGGSPNFNATGYIDSLHIFNKILTQSDINYLYNSGNGIEL